MTVETQHDPTPQIRHIHSERRTRPATITPPVGLPVITGDPELDHTLYLLASLAVEIAERSREAAA